MQKLLIILLLTCAYARLHAQRPIYPTDSIIHYTYWNKDTALKTHSYKVVNTYNALLQLKEKTIINWDTKQRKWVLGKLYTYEYMGTDIIEKLLESDHYGTPILKHKITYTLNSKKQVIKIEKEESNYNNTRSALTERCFYKYEKDSLREYNQFKQGTTLYLAQDAKYQYTADKTIIAIKIMTEHSPILQKEYVTTLSYNKLWQLLSEKKDYQFPIKQLSEYKGFKYDSKGLLSTDTIRYVNKSMKKDSCAFIHQYRQSENGLLQTELKYKTTTKGDFIIDANNEVVYFFYRKHSLSASAKRKYDYTIEDFIY